MSRGAFAIAKISRAQTEITINCDDRRNYGITLFDLLVNKPRVAAAVVTARYIVACIFTYFEDSYRCDRSRIRIPDAIRVTFERSV